MRLKAAWLVTTAAMITGEGLVPSAHAQQVEPTRDSIEIETITVTARKVEESLQDVPMSISAVTAEQIDRQGIDSLVEIARATPGFAFQNYNGSFPTPVIRGQSQTRLTNPVQNVAAFFNGIYLQRGYQIDADLLQIERVEVLRGPQSAALGRNAFAGAINFITKTPNDELQAGVSASAGENEYQKYTATVSGPLIDGVLRGMAGYTYSEYDGAWKNSHALADAPGARTKGNLGGYEKDSWVAGVNFTPTDSLSFDLTYAGSDRDIESAANYAMGTGHLESLNNYNCSPGRNTLATQNMLFCGTVPVMPVLAPGETRKQGYVVDPRSGSHITTDVVSLAGAWTINQSWSLNYLFGHAKGTFEGAAGTNRDQEVGYTGPGSVVGVSRGRVLGDATGNGEIEANSHELRVNYQNEGGLSAYLGLYQNSTEDNSKGISGFWVAQTSGPLTPLILDPTFAGSIDSSTETETASAFAFVQYAFSSWKVSAEGRQTREELEITDRPVPGNLFAAPAATADTSFDYFTPRGTVSYMISEDNSLYASVAKGVKSGGFNTGGSNPAAFTNPDEATYGIEKNLTYEIGSRNEFFDQRLVVNGTIFYIDSSGLQVTGQRTIAGGGASTTATVIKNLGDAQTVGAELEVNLRASDALYLYAGVGYAQAEYGDGVIDSNIFTLGLCATGTVCNANGDIGGNRLERSPELTGNAGFSFDHALWNDYGYYVRGLVSYTGDQFVNNTNTAKLDSFVVVDASVGVTTGGFEARLAADNLFDEEYLSSAFNTQFGSSAGFFVRNIVPFLGDGRRVSLTLSYKY